MKKKILIILLIFLIIVLISLTFIKINYSNKEFTDILIQNHYTLESKTLKGEKISNVNGFEIEIENTIYKYKKNDIIMYIYLYESYDEAKQLVEENIEQNNSLGLNTTVTTDSFYILQKECAVHEYCTYELAIDKYYITIDSSSEELNKKIEKELDTILKEM